MTEDSKALKLLVVDDDDVDRERIRRMLLASEIDAMIEEAASTEQSLDILKQGDIDCVIVDYRLGMEDGLGLIGEIQTNVSRRCALVMVTGLGDEGVAAKAMRLGAHDYLPKDHLKSPRLLRAILSAVHRVEMENKLHDMAHYDALTGLASRVLLLDRLQQVITHSARTDSVAALAFIDLDNFKPVNDTYGHEAGDQVLVEVASRLKRMLRGSDTIARIGGDEFVLLLIDLFATHECEALLNRVLSSLVEPITLDNNRSVRISASIGVTIVSDQEVDADTVLRRADHTMYKAKNGGKNNILFFDPVEEEQQQRRSKMQQAVDVGLQKKQFELYFQPKVDLRSKELVGMEALIRWNHPDQGLLIPKQFFSALEHAKQGSAIGEWVLREVLRQLDVWNQEGLGLTASVNISATHLQRSDFVDQLKGILSAMPNVTPESLELEVLETVSIDDMDYSVSILNRCMDLGVSIALDDFGTGYASLSYLKKLPLDTLKIDRGFVQNMLRDQDDRAIVESVIGLSRAFGYTPVAEGVETKLHEKMLIDLGCTHGQGFSIAEPMHAKEVPQWVKRHRSAYACTA